GIAGRQRAQRRYAGLVAARQLGWGPDTAGTGRDILRRRGGCALLQVEHVVRLRRGDDLVVLQCADDVADVFAVGRLERVDRATVDGLRGHDRKAELARQALDE